MRIQKDEKPGSWRVYVEAGEAGAGDIFGWVGAVKADPKDPTAAVLHMWKPAVRVGKAYKDVAFGFLRKAAKSAGFKSVSKETVDR